MTEDPAKTRWSAVEWPTREGFEDHFRAARWSPVLHRINAEALGDEYAPELETSSFVTLWELRRLSRGLGVGPGHRILDVGCGRGGPGMWIARETGASLTGLDFAQSAAAQSRSRASTFGVEARAAFLACDAAALALADRTHQGAVSIDALQLMPDRPAVIREVGRILQPGSVFAFTTWEWRPGSEPEGPTRFLTDHGPLLEAAGFALESRTENEDWPRISRAWSASVLGAREELVEAVGADEAESMVSEALLAPQVMEQQRRVLLVARLAG